MSKQNEKQTTAPETNEFPPIKQVHFAGEGIKFGAANVLVVDLDDGQGARTANAGASYKVVKEIAWHPFGVRVVMNAGGGEFIVPSDRISTIVTTRAPKTSRRR